MRNHGKIDANRLHPETRRALTLVLQAFNNEPGLTGIQISWMKKDHDAPPNVHVITESEPEVVAYWKPGEK